MTVSQTSRESRGTPSTSASDGDLIHLDTPVVSLHVHRPHMPKMPRMLGMRRMSREPTPRGQEMNRAVETARTFLPPPDRLAYYSGLTLLAAFGLVEWPIAAAIGAGTVIATRACSRQQPSMGAAEPTTRPSSRARTTTPTTTEPTARPTTRTRARTTTPSARATRATTATPRTSRTATRSATRTGTATTKPASET